MARVDLKNIPSEGKLAKNLVKQIEKLLVDRVCLMEVCGTHTMSIFKSGLKKILPSKLELISGPGCPVCVTDQADIDKAVKIARCKDVTLLTFGDMMNVPGSEESLAEAKASGADVKIIYSPLEAIKASIDNPEKKIVLLAVGFETTVPSVAVTLLEAKKKRLKNFFVFSLFKVIPPAMEALLIDGETSISGFICPGHVSTIIGAKPYQKIARQYRIPCVITGFEGIDILEGILRILRQCQNGVARVEIQYSRCVRPEGNPVAQKKIQQVFRKTLVKWRGLGEIPQSGLKLKKEFSRFDAEEIFPKYRRVKVKLDPKCLCGEVLRGVISPLKCPQFKKKCSPNHPLGPCMVSHEGTCAAYYWYGENSR